MPEDGLYTMEETFKADPQLCARFVQASLRGWLYAFNHEDETDIGGQIFNFENVVYYCCVFKSERYFIGVALQPHRRWDSTGELAGALYPTQHFKTWV